MADSVKIHIWERPILRSFFLPELLLDVGMGLSIEEKLSLQQTAIRLEKLVRAHRSIWSDIAYLIYRLEKLVRAHRNIWSDIFIVNLIRKRMQ